MHKKNLRIIPPILLLIALAALAVWYFAFLPAQNGDEFLTASGTIQVTQVQVAAELGGRVMDVTVEEGERVHTGDVLVRLNTAALDAQRLQAEAALAAAQAGGDAASANLFALDASLSALTAGTRPEQVQAAWQRLTTARQAYDSLTVTPTEEQLEAMATAVRTADAALANAQARLSAVEKVGTLPAAARDSALAAEQAADMAQDAAAQAYAVLQDDTQPLHAQIKAARLAWEQAQLILAQAEASLQAMEAIPDLPETALDAPTVAVEDAQALVFDCQAAYETLSEGEQVLRLEAAWKEVQEAQAALNGMGRSATTPLETLLNQRDAAAAQADAAQAQVDVARAALNSLEVQINKLTVLAPVDGVVLTRIFQPGEVAPAGATLLVLGVDEAKTITVYIPEASYGAITLGQAADLTVDSFPDETFHAVVIHIADQAQFTPRNVQTVEGRKNTVFAIRLQITDEDDRLKAGMPADVVFK